MKTYPPSFEVTTDPAFRIEEAVRAVQLALDASQSCFDSEVLLRSLFDQLDALRAGCASKKPYCGDEPPPKINPAWVDAQCHCKIASETGAFDEIKIGPAPTVTFSFDEGGDDLASTKSDCLNVHPLNPKALKSRLDQVEKQLQLLRDDQRAIQAGDDVEFGSVWRKIQELEQAIAAAPRPSGSGKLQSIKVSTDDPACDSSPAPDYWLQLDGGTLEPARLYEWSSAGRYCLILSY